MKRTEYLTTVEKRKLSNTLLGYGKLSDAAEITGLHKNTLAQINNAGKGRPETIAIIREKLLSNSKVTA